jgi:integrase
MVGKSPDELLWCRGDGRTYRHRQQRIGSAQRSKAARRPMRSYPRHRPRTAAHGGVADDRERRQRETVQAQLGHKTATMTLDQYGHPVPDDLDDVADKMDDPVCPNGHKKAGAQ